MFVWEVVRLDSLVRIIVYDIKKPRYPFSMKV